MDAVRLNDSQAAQRKTQLQSCVIVDVGDKLAISGRSWCRTDLSGIFIKKGLVIATNPISNICQRSIVAPGYAAHLPHQKALRCNHKVAEQGEAVA